MKRIPAASLTGMLLMASVFGCAEFAVRPPTPAKYFDSTGLHHPIPGERFFFTIFGSQSTPKIARYCHTWGAVIRVKEHPGQEVEIEYHSISWLPATLNIRPLYLHPEPGVNLGIHETMRFALANRERISQWGPYECRPSFYHRFLLQKQFLDSGQVGYQCTDDIGEAARKGNGCDCIHAISDMDPEYGRGHFPLIRFGDSASKYILKEIQRRGALINPDQEHTWLNETLGLSCYPIVHRHL